MADVRKCMIFAHFDPKFQKIKHCSVNLHRTMLTHTGWLKIKYLTRKYAISSQPVV